MIVSSSASRRSVLDAVCAWLALGVPLAVTLWRIAPQASWEGDLATIRGLEMLPTLGSGALSGWLTQPLLLLPLGGRELRVVIVGALAVAIAGRLTYRQAHELLARNAATPRLAPVLALAGALLASLSPSWQCQGTVAGGSTVAAALVVGLIALRAEARPSDARFWALAGILVGLAFLENLIAGLVASALLGAEFLGRSQSGLWRLPLSALGAALATALVHAVPNLARPLAKRQWFELGAVVSPPAGVLSSEATSSLQRFIDEQGLLALTMAALGALVLAFTPSLRRVIVPWLLIVAAAVVFEGDGARTFSANPRTVLTLLSISGVAIAATLGVQSVALGLVRARVPLAGPAGALLVVCFLSLSLVNAEDSGRWVERQGASAAQVWTDEALAGLPTGAVLLARSSEVVWRLWAARATSGDREDIVLVPLPLIEQGAIAADLLQREPALARLIRDLAVTGRASEFSLSTLADARPLYVEGGGDWDRRLLDHLIPRSLWMEFAPHALGRSDRVQAMREGRDAFRRVLDKASEKRNPDAYTLGVLVRRAKERAVVHGALGDRDALETELGDLETMGADPAFVREVRRRLESHPKGAIDVGGLLVLGATTGFAASS